MRNGVFPSSLISIFACSRNQVALFPRGERGERERKRETAKHSFREIRETIAPNLFRESMQKTAVSSLPPGPDEITCN